jgi:hypothetical protein
MYNYVSNDYLSESNLDGSQFNNYLRNHKLMEPNYQNQTLTLQSLEPQPNMVEKMTKN